MIKPPKRGYGYVELVAGAALTATQKAEVANQFVHWHLSGKTFEDWVETHAFYITEKGRLSTHYRRCEPVTLL